MPSKDNEKKYKDIYERCCKGNKKDCDCPVRNVKDGVLGINYKSKWNDACKNEIRDRAGK